MNEQDREMVPFRLLGEMASLLWPLSEPTQPDDADLKRKAKEVYRKYREWIDGDGK